MIKKTGLGRGGVSLLFGEEKEKYFECDVSLIFPNKHQPRTQFNQHELDELAESIKEKGVIQPLIITTNPDNKRYELIAGERRLRASKIVGLKSVPVILMDIQDENSQLELALIENIQRTDLNPIEEAEAYRKLIDKCGYTQEETAKRVGKQRSTVTNLLRLLKLPETIKNDISSGVLSEGHGRVLIRLADEPLKMQEVRDAIVKKGLSVRESERVVKKATITKSSTKSAVNSQITEIPLAYVNALATQLTNYLNTKISIQQNGTRGKIEIEYYSADDLERVVSLLINDH